MVAQQSNTQLIEDLVEEIAQGSEVDLDFSQITDNLYYYLANPLNLNEASTEELESLYVLNDFQIMSLQSYISTHNKMLTVYELQLIEGLDNATIKKILPFITVTQNGEIESWKIQNAIKHGNHQIFTRFSTVLEKAEGYNYTNDSILNSEPNKYYPGNRARIYTRYKFNYKNKLQWGITADKDPGEELFKGSQKQGFDFYSAHLQLNDIGIFKTAILGDYQVQFGQGLIMWSYISSGKTSCVMDIKKRGKGLHRYSSTDENAFLRGGAVTLKKGGLSFSTFASHKYIDANVEHDSTENIDYFGSLQNTGIHATQNQLNDKDAISETAYGANASWQKKQFRIGVSGIHYAFSEPFIIENKPQYLFRFSGNSNTNLSTDVELRFKKVHVFSEAAISESGGKAILAGALMELSSQFRTSVLYRNYEKNFHALYSNAFREGSRPQNEEGVYIGAEIHPFKKWKIAGYYDMYKHPWLNYNTSAPTKGSDYLVQTSFTASRNLSMYWRYKDETKEADNKESITGLATLNEIRKRYFRYQVAYNPLNNWEFRNRIELSYYNVENNSGEQGYMFYQDVIYKPTAIPISMVVRYAIFDTETYDARIYTYENDVLYAYSVPALYDKGTRTYVLLHYKLANKLDLWLRYSQTWYAYKKEIGSGSDLIKSNSKSEIKFQLRRKF